jgi:hypothetical protein
MSAQTLLIGAQFAQGISNSASAYTTGAAEQTTHEINAITYERDARAAIDQARYNSARIRDRNKRLKGTQVSRILKSGVQLSGSALDVIRDSAVQGELDAMSEEYKGLVEHNKRKDAALYEKLYAKSAGRSARTGAVTSIFDAATNAFLIKNNPAFDG